MGQDTLVGPTISTSEGETHHVAQTAGGLPPSDKTPGTATSSIGSWVVWTQEWGHFLWTPEYFGEYRLAKGFYDLSVRSGVECKLTFVYHETQTN